MKHVEYIPSVPINNCHFSASTGGRCSVWNRVCTERVAFEPPRFHQHKNGPIDQSVYASGRYEIWHSAEEVRLTGRCRRFQYFSLLSFKFHCSTSYIMSCCFHVVQCFIKQREAENEPSIKRNENPIATVHHFRPRHTVVQAPRKEEGRGDSGSE